MQVIARLLMIFLIAGPPALCRAGLLVRCCESPEAEVVAEEAPSSCCKSGCGTGKQAAKPQAESNESKRPASESPRKCSDCAAVCAGVFKPSETPPSLTPTSPAMYERIGDLDTVEPQPVLSFDDLAFGWLSIPYPASDLPLQI